MDQYIDWIEFNYYDYIGGSDKKFNDPMQPDQDIRRRKNMGGWVFLFCNHPSIIFTHIVQFCVK